MILSDNCLRITCPEVGIGNGKIVKYRDLCMCVCYICWFYWGWVGWLFPFVNFLKSYLPSPTLYLNTKVPTGFLLAKTKAFSSHYPLLPPFHLYNAINYNLLLNSPALALLIFHQPHSSYLYKHIVCLFMVHHHFEF